MKHLSLTLIAILFLVLTACTGTTSNSTSKTIILPNLEGKTIQNYTEVLNTTKITIITSTEHHATIPNDQFIRYSGGLKAGDEVKYGEMIYIYFSKGPQKVADTENPQIHGANNVEIPYASEFNPLEGITVTDNVDQDLMNRLIVTGTINTWDLDFSTQDIMYSVMDKSGNLTQVTRQVKIVPNVIDTRYTDSLVLETDYLGKSFINDGIGIVTLVSKTDGDTARFRDVITGEEFSLRFLGIDTPENTPMGGYEPWGDEASAFTTEKLQNAQLIVLEAEGIRFEGYGRYIGWVWVDGRLLNLEIVENAYSQAKGSSDSKYNDIFNLADLKTQGTQKRIWGELDPNFNYNN